jgi:hypothetical protein
MSRELAVDSLKETFSTLSEDIDAIQELYENIMSDALARALARSYSAYIEGTLFQLREVAINSAKKVPNIFSADEWVLLIEKKPFLNSKGEIEVKDNFERFLPMLLFTMKQYVKIHGATFNPDTGDNRWDHMKRFVSFRNRLMHPKSDSDLDFTKEDLNSMLKAVHWFHDNSLNMFKACQEADEKYSSGHT